MELHNITIEQFKQRNLHSGFCYKNHLFITNRIEDVKRFKSPCRIDAITVLVCTGGELDCSINLKHYHISSNMILVNFPDDIIQIQHTTDLEAYAILISSDLLNKLEIDFKQRSDFYLDIRQQAMCHLLHTEIITLKPYYSLLCDNIEKQCTETPEIIRGIIKAFSYTIISMMRLSQTHEINEDNVVMTRNKMLFQKFIALVKLYHANTRGVKFYANKLCLTPNYLSGAIKEYTGKTATEWVNEYVILEAKVMLKNSDINISEISDKLNFPSQSSFGKYFKQQVGIGPKQYKNQ